MSEVPATDTRRRITDRLHHEQDGIAETRRNRAILKRWSNRQLLPAFLRWVENFTEIRRQVGIINWIVRRWTNKTLYTSFCKWSTGVGEDARVGIIFMKVLLRWTRQNLKVLLFRACFFNSSERLCIVGKC